MSTVEQPGVEEAANMPAAHAIDLVKTYGKGDAVVRALNGVTLEFGRGQFTAVMGPSGSGKSTLMHCMAGLDTPTSGRTFVGAREIGLLDDAGLTDMRRHQIGFVFQSFNLVPTLSALDNITLPADLARRRPDIRQAEASLHAATAQIGVSVADLFPRLTLMASGGVQSETAGNLLEWASRFGSFGPTLTLPVFDRGRWKSVHLNRVRAQEAALNYERTVLGALHEVENALAAYRADQDRRAWLETAVAQNLDALTLSRQRYESGVESFIEVLDVERIWQQNRLALADSTTAVSTDLVHLYRALGGGWQPPVNSPDNSLPDNSL